MSGVATAIGLSAAAGVAGAKMSADASSEAADKTAGAIKAANTQYLQDTAQQRALFPALRESLMDSPNELLRLQSVYSKAFSNLFSAIPQAPTLQNDVNLDLENDPIYQQQKEQSMRELNRRYAAGGKAYSSDADNAITRNLLSFMQDSYGRELGDVNRANNNAMAQYGVANDNYSKMYSNILDQFNMQKNLYDSAFAERFNLASLGTNAATQTGNAMMSGAGALGSAYKDNATNLVSAYMDAAGTIQDAAAAGLGAYENEQLLDYLKGKKP